jgi:hypothetical protein
VVYIGMGINYRLLGGGLLALDLKGTPAYQNDVGYCDALVVVPRPESDPLIVGLFLEPSPEARYLNTTKGWFLAGFDAASGGQLWRTPLAGGSKRYWYRRALLVASRGGGAKCVVVSLGGTHLVDLTGKELAYWEGVQTELVADFDADRVDELVVRSSPDDYSRRSMFSIRSITGETMWHSPAGRWHICAVEDLDGDRWKELCAIRQGRSWVVAVFGKVPP